MTKKRSRKRRESQIEYEETEMSPGVPDGKWGWFVVFNSFVCNMIVDGMQYTFANFLMPMSMSLHASVSSVSLIGSLLSGFYNFSGPIAGALGNKFGFRMVTITGSIVSGGGLMLSYFAPNIAYLYFFYGILGGLGFGMIYMASVITTSLYFEKYRALAASLSVCGTGVGTFVFAPLGNFLVSSWGWNLALVVEGGIILVCILCGLAFKPLEMITVIPLSRQPSDASEDSSAARRGSIYYPMEARKTLPNEAYPTFKEALHLQEMAEEERRTTAISLLPRGTRRSTYESLANFRQMPIYSVVGSSIRLDEEGANTLKSKCQKFCRICCFNFWHCRCKKRALTLGDRPMYRDDIFYEGSLVSLARYTSSERLRYHLSVTRVPDAQEIQQHVRQKCCVCHQAFLRTCITMTGLQLLTSRIFVFLCISSFLYTMALYIPYVFIRKLAVQYDVSHDQSVWMVSAIGISNTAGRLASGIIKSFFQVNAALFALIGLSISGIFSFVFLFGRNLGWILSFSCIFGFFTAPFISLRPVIIVDFLGLEKLTNAFGLVLLSQGIASIIGPPLAGLLEELTGENAHVIYLSGTLMIVSSMALLVSILLNSDEEVGKGNYEAGKEDQDETDVEDKMIMQKRASNAETREKTEAEVEEEEEEEEEEGSEDERGVVKEEELDTYALIPPNGGWGWIVVLCAFYCNVVVDGIQLTFGVFLTAISKTFDAEVAQVALAGSLMFGIHLLMGPVCAGFSKVFGLRPVSIIGSLICCFGVGVSYFATGYWFLYISFGLIGGIGLGLVYMNSLVITTVYFTTLMPIAIAIVVCGTGVGTMVFAALGNHLLDVTTWQNSFLMQAALAGSMALAAATFKPLKPVKVALSPDATSSGRSTAKQVGSHDGGETSSKKTVFIKTGASAARGSLASLQTMHSIIWNFVEEGVVSNKRSRHCKCRCGRCKKKRKKPTDEAVLVLREVKNDTRRRSYVERNQLQEAEEEGFPLERLNSSMSYKTVFARIDFEKKQKDKACDAIKRTIQAMLDCHLMTSYPFVKFTISGAIQMAGFLNVFIYEKDRCISMGFSEDMSVYFLIFLGGANMFWRLFLGGLASLPKVNYWMLAIVGIILGGLATVCSGLNSSVYYQFAFCCLFGLGIASFAVFRIVLLVDLVGKDRVENATGINILFMGILCIVSPPFFGWLMKLTHSYDIVFMITGLLILISGLMLIGLNKVKL